MITLVLTFFILLYVTAQTAEPSPQIQLVLSAFQGVGNNTGGSSLSPGKLAEMGNTVNSLPSMRTGRSLGDSRRIAVSLFEPEIKNRTVSVTQDERGLVVSLSADAFFDVGSAELKRETAREVLRKLGVLLSAEALRDKKVRFEGHTDNEPTDPDGKWPTNWHLGSERAINSLIYTAELANDPNLEKRMHAASFSQYGTPSSPSATPGADPNETTRAERAMMRRVDVIILTDGNL
jgi:chemotaxis protein MotB